MNIVMLCENDPAGMAIAFANALNRTTDHSCRVITTATRYGFGFEKDLHLPSLTPDGLDEVFSLLEAADILHFHVLADEDLAIGPRTVREFSQGKAMLHHHHGHPHFRANPDHYRDKYARLGRKALVATPDLLRLLPEAAWQPNLVPINHPLYTPQENSDNGTIRIGQAPTRQDLKNTRELTDTVAGLQSKLPGVAVELDIITDCPHAECLARKNRCHLVFDHMQGYYGVSSLESMAQGKPVIAGLDAWNSDHIRQWTGSDRLPWIIAKDGGELQQQLGQLIANADFRNETGHASRTFMENHWSEEQVLAPLLATYESLLTEPVRLAAQQQPHRATMGQI